MMDNSDEYIKQLQKEEQECRSLLEGISGKLTEKRSMAAKKVEKEVISSLKMLGMPNVRFQVHISATESPTPKGMDKVSFLFSGGRLRQPYAYG